MSNTIKEESYGNDYDISHKEIPVYLTPFHWHLLLQELEHSMRIVNRESNAEDLYKKIASELEGKNVVFKED